MKRPTSIPSFLDSLAPNISAERIARMDRYTNQLFERALTLNADGTVFVVTGDIPAMWIRDSTWQVRPLLRMNPDLEVLRVVAGVSRMQARLLSIDPYANAFNSSPSGLCWHKDFVDQSDWVFERKFEIDSIAAFFELALNIHRIGGFTEHLDETFWDVTHSLLDLLVREQTHIPSSYRFVRVDAPEHDFLSHDGFGAPFEPNGIVWSGFRPSDDRCVYPFHIPGNAHLVVVLRELVDVALRQGFHEVSDKSHMLSTAIEGAIKRNITTRVIPYEVDGLGNQLLEDDPNFPSLLSLPFLGWCAPDDHVYLSTRQWIFSNQHRLFRVGHGVSGLASDHTPDSHVWPLSIAMRGLTALEYAEKIQCLEMLENSDGGTGSMHESFDINNPKAFTRPWFSWADMAYCDLALDVAGVARL